MDLMSRIAALASAAEAGPRNSHPGESIDYTRELRLEILAIRNELLEVEGALDEAIKNFKNLPTPTDHDKGFFQMACIVKSLLRTG